MSQLIAITDRLANETNISASITNTANMEVMCKNKTGAAMAAEAGSVVDWFNTLLSSTPKITVQLRRKNGSSQINEGLPIVLNVAPIDQPGHQAPTQPSLPAIPEGSFGLNGGLNAAMIYNYMDYPKVYAEKEAYKLENIALKEKIYEMKNEALETRFSEDKANGNKEMLTGLAPILLQLIPMLAGKGGAASVPGLGSPAPAEDLSQSKLNLIEVITLSADFVSDYLFAIVNAMNTNQDFGKEQMELLKKYNLITT